MATSTSSPLHATFAAHPNVTRVPSNPLPPTADPDAVNAIQGLVERLEANLTPPGPTSDERWYGWLPLRLSTFLGGMLHARKILGPGQHRFVDVGSGIGTKLILARELSFKPAGVERWEPYVETSRRLAPFAHVFHADATSFGQYHHFDVVYCYGLASGPVEDASIKQAITERMKPGALFFTARRPFPEGLEHMGGLIWRKPS